MRQIACHISVGILLSVLLQGCATIRKFSPLESNTLEARQLTQQAQSAMHREDWGGAESKLLSAIERCPDDNLARACLAEVLWNRGAKQAAVEQLARSIELSGQRDAEPLTQLGQMQLALGNPRAAQQRADEAIRYNKSLADAWTLRGFALREQGQSQNALRAFFRSLSLRPDHTPTRLEIARLLREQGQSERALAVLEGAKKETPDESCPFRAELCYLRGLLMRDVHRPHDALIAFANARESGLDAPELLFHLAEAQLAAGQIQHAHETLAAAPTDGGPQLAVALAELRARIQQQQGSGNAAWR